MKLILASKSPRRREILTRHGISFDVLSVETDETLPLGTPPERGVEILAVRKGAAAAACADPDAYILSSDTLVELDGEALGKPTDEEDAFRMLKRLSAVKHTVRTGVAVHHGGRVFSGVDSTDVYFRPLTDGEIRSYIRTGEPMDKAGAYGIQGAGGKFVDRISGNFDTVMGLSFDLSRKLLCEAGMEIPFAADEPSAKAFDPGETSGHSAR